MHPQIRALDLWTLELVVAMADEGSIRAAATRQGIAASVVSRRLRALEDILGISLFERRSSGPRVTLAGQRFLTTARRVRNDIDAAVREARCAGSVALGQLVIGTCFSASAGRVRDALMRFLHRYPQIRLGLIEGNRAELLEAVRDGQADLVILLGPDDEAHLDRLAPWQEATVLGIPENHRLASQRGIRWKDLPGETFVMTRRGAGPEMQEHVQDLLPIGHEAKFQIHDVNREGLLNLVGAGLGIAALAESATGARYPGVVFRSVGDEAGPTKVAAAAYWDPKRDNPALRRFITLLRADHSPRSRIAGCG